MELIDTSIFTDFSTQFNMTQLDEHDKKWLFRRNNWRICLSFINITKKDVLLILLLQFVCSHCSLILKNKNIHTFFQHS